MNWKKKVCAGGLAVSLALTALVSCVFIPGLNEQIFEAVMSRRGLAALLAGLGVALVFCAASGWLQGELRLLILKEDTKVLQKRLVTGFLADRPSPAGSWIGYICKTAEEYETARLQLLINVLTILFSFLFLTLYICISSPLLFLAVLILTAALLILVLMKSSVLKEQSRIMAEKDSQIVALQWEHINNQEISGLLNYDKLFRPYTARNEEKKDAAIRLGRAVFLPAIAKTLGSVFLTVCIAFAGGLLCGRGMLSPAQLFGVLSAMPALAASLFMIPSVISDYYKYRGLKKVLPAVTDTVVRKAGRRICPDCITVTGLCYRGILNQVSLSLNRGVLHVVTGESGCGKTTFLKLLTGIYAPEEGIVKYDGVNVDFNTLKRSVFYLSASPWVPNIPLIEYVLPERNAEERADDSGEAASSYKRMLASLHMEYLDKRETLDFQTLSEGEKQKIMFLKMFFSPRSIWICDEPTNKLDAESEAEVLRFAKKLIQERKILAVIVTHRPSTVRYADTVWRVEEGAVINMGDCAQRSWHE